MSAGLLLTAVIVAVTGCFAGTDSGEMCRFESRSERKFFAHYMGCFPATSGWLPVSMTNNVERFRSGVHFEKPGGGGWIDCPLQPWGFSQSAEANADLEIRRAIRAGLDGFAVDAWAGSDSARRIFEVLLRAAEKHEGRFQVTICLDPACHRRLPGVPMWQLFANSVKDVLRFKESPAFAKFDGLPLIFTYHSRFIVGRDAPEKVAEAWRNFRAAVPEKLFLHGDIDYLIRYDDPKADRLAAARFGAENFEAVGGFLGAQGEWGLDRAMAAEVTKAGKVWSQPMCGQYQNHSGNIITSQGLDRLAAMWENARATGSRLIQYVTWNDYGEETSLAPNCSTSYTLTRLCRHWSDWWKTGKEPKIETDELHFVFRRFTDWEATAWPFSSRTRPLLPEPVLEVATLLKVPASVEVKGYGSYSAPAGLFRRQFPLRCGKVSARICRGNDGATDVVLELTAPEEVGDHPLREDFMLYAYGSNFDEEWARDFPGVAPLKAAFYTDEDGDGMANWFEMLFFGRWNDMTTASCADPAADPDGDGFTNLEEFRKRTHPLVADKPYVPGHIWDSTDIAKKEFVWNPVRDDCGRDIWFMLRPDGRRIVVGGDQMKTRWFHDGNFVASTNGVVRFGGRRGDTYSFAWRAPEAGVYDLSAEVGIPAKVAGDGVIHARLSVPGVPERRRTLKRGDADVLQIKDVKLEAGDFVKVISDLTDMWGVGPLEVRRFRILKKQ